MRRVRIKDHWRERRIFTVRSIVAGVLVAMLLLTVAGRLFYLQVLRYAYYSELSQGNRIRIEPIPPSRGLILDRTGVILADNMPAYQLEVERDEVGSLEQLDESLQRLVKIGLLEADDLPSIMRTILSHRAYESVPIKLELTDQEMAVFALHRFEFDGFDVHTRLSRHYPFGPLAVQAIGYVAAIGPRDLAHIDPALYAGTTLIGKLGVERRYEGVLHGKPGFREVLVNAAGRPVTKEGSYRPKLKMQLPVAGSDLVLSLDMRVQHIAEDALQGLRGAVVAIDPRNGDVIALASSPSFDPNEFARGLTDKEYAALESDPNKPLINRALAGAYPPGSTAKPYYALAALHYGVMTPDQTIFCPGYFHLPGSSHIYHCWKHGGHGAISMVRAIAQSCDVYFYNVANRLGIDRMHHFLSEFGFGKPTGIDIPGERPGLMPSPQWKRHAFKDPANQVWFPGETLIVGIGQGYMLATPLQLAHAVATIAARGRAFVPRLVIGIRPPGSKHVIALPPIPAPAVRGLTPDQWAVIDAGMEAAAKPGGTAWRALVGAPYQIAAKTGTAQVFSLKNNEKYNAKQINAHLRDNALFISFAPADDPKLAVAVMVENATGEGGSVAAPIARKVFDAYLLPAQPAAAAADTAKGHK
ncbi:MAG TPA: penicillin-binding protein 2 [Steroidobacteraceae bacterium]|nr:penicillin-binding protein 2 [Steroidobacteraceae bacterium]